MTFDLDEDELKATRKMNKADRNEIEVGEYVRTEEGYIGILIEYIPNALNYLKIDVGKEIRRDNGMSDNYIYTRYGFQLKHSKQLIDLVEVGDYVNGELITDKWDTRISSIRSNFSEEDIKTILTKEIYMANCYKVGGEDE